MNTKLANQLWNIEGGELARWNFDNYVTELQNPQSLQFIKYNSTGEPEAFILYRRLGSHLIEILQIAVKTKSQGAGTQLLNEFLEYLKQFAPLEIQLEFAKNNAPAFNLYKKFNFIKVGERKKYYKDGDDAVLMTLKLV